MDKDTMNMMRNHTRELRKVEDEFQAKDPENRAPDQAAALAARTWTRRKLAELELRVQKTEKPLLLRRKLLETQRGKALDLLVVTFKELRSIGAEICLVAVVPGVGQVVSRVTEMGEEFHPVSDHVLIPEGFAPGDQILLGIDEDGDTELSVLPKDCDVSELAHPELVVEYKHFDMPDLTGEEIMEHMKRKAEAQ